MKYGLSARAEAHLRAIAAKHLHSQCFYQGVVKDEDRERGFENWRRNEVIGYMVPEWISFEELFIICDPYLKARFYGEKSPDAVMARSMARNRGYWTEAEDA